MDDKNFNRKVPTSKQSQTHQIKNYKQLFGKSEDLDLKSVSNSRFEISNLHKVVKKIIYYLKLWFLMSKNSLMIILSKKLLFLIFLTGKLLRFGFFTAFLFFLISGSKSLAGYSANQVIFFFLTFNVVDILAQFLYREVYRFRPLVISGDFDLIMVKPANALFRVLMGGADFIDFVTIPLILAAVWYVGRLLNPTFLQVFYYILLVINGLLIATAFHIAVLSLGIITLEINHTIWIYRDLTHLGRLPVDIYREPIRGIITFLVPVGIMITLPAKALMGLVTPVGVFISFGFGIAAFFLSLKFWNYAIKFYTSASS